MNWLAKTINEIIDTKSHLKTIINSTNDLNETYIVKVFPNQLKAFEIYGKDNIVHRTDGPAVIEYYFHQPGTEENVFKKEYWKEGLSYYSEEYYPNGSLKKILHGNNFSPSNADGPAIIHYNRDGSVTDRYFFYEGKCVGKNLTISGKDCVFEYYANLKILS